MKNYFEDDRSQADWDNYSRQLNPDDDTYWQSRGLDGKPDDDD